MTCVCESTFVYVFVVRVRVYVWKNRLAKMFLVSEQLREESFDYFQRSNSWRKFFNITALKDWNRVAISSRTLDQTFAKFIYLIRPYKFRKEIYPRK